LRQIDGLFGFFENFLLACADDAIRISTLTVSTGAAAAPASTLSAR